MDRKLRCSATAGRRRLAGSLVSQGWCRRASRTGRAGTASAREAVAVEEVLRLVQAEKPVKEPSRASEE